jgi:hypothetical protein
MNWNPSDRQLRQFALIALAALPAAAWIWSSGNPAATGLAAAAGLGIGGVGIFRPRRIRFVFLALMLAAMPIGMVVTEIALAAIYFGVFVPLGLCMRWLGRDPLERGIDRSAKSYWQIKKRPKNAASYLRQA